MIKEINFPENEYSSYQERLNNNKTIYTTRVSQGVNKYELGKIYNSIFGNLKVIFLKHYTDIKDHPFYYELKENQIKEINIYLKENGYDVIGLIKAE